ncbi:MAG: HAMP domain-containing protein [Anaerolineae bacterium]|jgi:heavy metal sensor kinase|nr:HAMP domain-containing protein [Anaerolineae bacterium]MBT4312056.1 HAMP domain-containing protein [Anaerolineae bacterium]MBT4842120.1 HAMP domain-containing protein [Anaerolineae bacterium]MBT6061229.1 HAMP domain-containing protein [Anaerolineae bacterium]MBT6322182.1 HAMP domain-containing protein [Anaerolineae bacterium]
MLRARLTLFYSTLLGGVLLLFGMAVYTLVNVTLIRQVDELLNNTASEILEVTHVDSVGEINTLRLPPLDMATNMYVQVWNRQGILLSSSLDRNQFPEALNIKGLTAIETNFRDIDYHGVHMRVLSVPLSVGGRSAGTMQVATSLAVIDSVREDLLYILIMTAIFAIIIAGIGSWLTIERSLAPLDTIVATTRQINRADDLSRRIPYKHLPNDEVGQLVLAFNQTLERLETIFTSQQRFLADISHELRTPLTVIKGNVGLMRRMNTVDEETLLSIDEEANRLTRLVGDLLLLAKAETGKLPLQKETLELDTLLFEVLQQMHVLAGDKLTIKLAEIDQILILGDRDRLKQVLLNLISNAIQYTPEGGEIILSLSKMDGKARFIVQDTGPGIPAEDLPHIFERFYRTEKSRTRSKTPGFGLGLSIAYWIITKHNGEIDVESEEGKGTIFKIFLPLLDPEKNKPTATLS